MPKRKVVCRKPIKRKTLTTEQKFNWLNKKGVIPEQYSAKPKWALRSRDAKPTKTEIKDAYSFFKKNL